jgi:hypothetical protein
MCELNVVGDELIVLGILCGGLSVWKGIGPHFVATCNPDSVTPVTSSSVPFTSTTHSQSCAIKHDRMRCAHLAVDVARQQTTCRLLADDAPLPAPRMEHSPRRGRL